MNAAKEKFVDRKLIPTMDWLCYDDDPKIREKSQELILPLTATDREAIAKMISYIDASYADQADKYNIRAGIAIAGIQIHYPKRVAYIHLDDEEEHEKEYLLANPKIVYQSYRKGYVHKGEGCLSVETDRDGLVPRSYEIKVEALNLFSGKPMTIKAKGILAICLQHEIDHMDGKLYYDKINLFDPMHTEKDWTEI